ncbi:hypothetical protein Poly51_38760 [Rubripirellula tenax]|uniref:BON domain protein n=1 Tax=Rubripirellula tenax TaxID=2528015 RepID=A0A5C6EQD5_9BACT|nr:BON domain-containing protein [Rubripirellula tenax]TWU50584.1 hypothetical protein Poly51_38760 [Rubripirellula tenax]
MSLVQSVEHVVTRFHAKVSTRPPEDASDEKTLAFEQAIRRAGHRGLDRIEVMLRDGEIVSSGRVKSYYLKQLAQEAVRSPAIGLQIRNNVRVEL